MKWFFPGADEAKEVVATFDYTDGDGKFCYQKLKSIDKDFAMRHRDEKGKWAHGRGGDRRLYNFFHLSKVDDYTPIWWVEGEKDVETLFRMGLIATCNDDGGGKKKFRKEYIPHFVGKTVFVLRDNDKPGYDLAQEVIAMLTGQAREVIAIELPGVEHKEDVTAWLEQRGGTKQRLLELAAELQRVHRHCNAAEPVAGDAFETQEDRDANTAVQEEIEQEETNTATWKPFPIDSLPALLRNFAVETSAALLVDPASLVLPMFPTFGSLIGNSRVASPKASWREPAIFWSMLVSESSNLKSPPFEAAIGPIKEVQKALYDQGKAEEKTYKRDMRDWMQAESKKKNGYVSKDNPDAPEKPVAQQILIDDITVESIIQVLDHNPLGLVLLQDEVSAWLSSFGRYKNEGGGGSDSAFWLKSFGARSHTYNRKTSQKQVVHIERCSLSVGGNIPPDVFRGHANNGFFESGMCSRILLARPPKQKRVWTEAIPSDSVKDSYRLLAKDMYFRSKAIFAANDNVPVVIHFDDESRKAFIEWYNEWGERQHATDGPMSYALAKLEAYCIRFALLFCVVDCTARGIEKEVITLDHLKPAMVMTEWFAEEARRVYSVVTCSKDTADTERLVTFIRRHDGVMSPRRLMKSNHTRYPRAASAISALQELVDRKMGKWEERSDEKNGGRPAKVFVLAA